MSSMLKFETEIFTEKCLKICKDTIDASVSQAHADIRKVMMEEIENNIIQKIRGQDSYDYKQIDEVPRIDGTSLRSHIHKHAGDNYKHIADNFFIDFVPNEKICVYDINFDDNLIDEFIVTTYGGILYGMRTRGIHNYTIIKTTRLNFWIPVEYIIFLKSVIANINSTETCTLLKTMKETLYNPKFISLYARDILEENKVLKKQNDEYEREKKIFYDKVDKFTKSTQGFYDLEKEKMEFEQYKQDVEMRLQEETQALELYKTKLQIGASKVKLERAQLEQDKEKYNKLIEEVDLSTI